MITYTWTGNGIPRFEKATDALGKETTTHRAYRLAINRKGRKAFTQVKRALAKQTGLTQRKAIELGNIKTYNANFSNLAFTIKSSGNRISLKEFGAKQFSFGVRAKPWGKTRRFEGAFISAGFLRSGTNVNQGHVFIRQSGASYPIKRLYGPSMPVEIVKDQSKQAFEDVANELPQEIAITLDKLSGGIIK